MQAQKEDHRLARLEVARVIEEERAAALRLLRVAQVAELLARAAVERAVHGRWRLARHACQRASRGTERGSDGADDARHGGQRRDSKKVCSQTPIIGRADARRRSKSRQLAAAPLSSDCDTRPATLATVATSSDGIDRLRDVHQEAGDAARACDPRSARTRSARSRAPCRRARARSARTRRAARSRRARHADVADEHVGPVVARRAARASAAEPAVSHAAPRSPRARARSARARRARRRPPAP